MALPASVTEFILPPIEEKPPAVYESAFQPMSNELHNQTNHIVGGAPRKLFTTSIVTAPTLAQPTSTQPIPKQSKLKKEVDPLEGTFITRVDETGTNIVYKYVSGKYERKCMVYECAAVAKIHGKCSKHVR